PFSLPDHAASFRPDLSGGDGGAFLLFADGRSGPLGGGDDFSRGSADGFAGVDHSVVEGVGCHEYLLWNGFRTADDTREGGKSKGGKYLRGAAGSAGRKTSAPGWLRRANSRVPTRCGCSRYGRRGNSTGGDRERRPTFCRCPR